MAMARRFLVVALQMSSLDSLIRTSVLTEPQILQLSLMRPVNHDLAA